MRTIGVDEHDDVHHRFGERQPERFAFAEAPVLEDPGAVRRGDRCRPVT